MTIFCNPASPTNGTGTLLDPKNTWAGQDWSVDSDFAQIAEVPLLSTSANAINPNVAGTATTRSTLSTVALTLANVLRIRSGTAFDHEISGTPTAKRELVLPDKAGTFALLDDISTSISVGPIGDCPVLDAGEMYLPTDRVGLMIGAYV
jgi:hypothetical protein